MWSGAIADIPAGWVLCDGNNDTPDLRDQFIVASGDTYDTDDTGGVSPHNHTFNAGTHNHNAIGGTGMFAFVDIGLNSDNVGVSGVTANQANLPPYLALAFVMKT